jgi:Zn-dependent peptidase ImmA (M78 family)/DNA-binding XRE family transcriptional regulator
MKLKIRQLTFAREYRGYSQSDLARNIPGLSQSNLSKFEKGINTLSDELLRRIIDFLNFPVAFFDKTISNSVENPHYRKRASTSKKDVISIESSIRLFGYIIDQMNESIEWPEFKLEPIDLEDGYSVKNIANHTRKRLGILPGDPVRNIISLLESHGIIVVEIEFNDKFDGACIRTDAGFPLIVINRRFSNDRKRRTLAHELGHLLMHVLGSFPLSDYRNDKEREKEADLFASEFLMPENDIKNSLYGLKLSELAGLKRTWLTSMASILRRAYELNCIDKDRYTYLNIEMSRLGYKKNEPIDVYIDDPTLFRRGYELHKIDLEYSDEELSNAFCLPIDVVNKYYKQSILKGKLRVA